LIEQYLYDKIKIITAPDKRLIYASGKIVETPDKHILKALQYELYMTERTFQRLFEAHTGVAPNLFRRINLFDKTFRQINGSGFTNFSEVTYQNGYADQSHMIRVFKEFTHLTPSAYLRMRPDA
jgi:AraC-like DNA-binding protein